MTYPPTNDLDQMYSGVARLIEAASVDVPEMFKKAAAIWAKLDGRARELEEGKAFAFAKRCKAMGEMSVAAAEREVKASQEWHDIVTEIVRARTSANEALGEMTYWKLKHEQWHAMRTRQEAMAA